jgi:hypothetical protein
MSNNVHDQKVVFRCDTRPYVVAGIFAGLLLALGILVAFKKRDWSFVVLSGSGTAVLFFALAYIKMEIWSSGFIYRNLTGTRSVEFANIGKAYFERVIGHGMEFAAFWVQLRDGRKMKINLRTLPIRASALLFTALQRERIPIEVPEILDAQRLTDDIREEQLKLIG